MCTYCSLDYIHNSCNVSPIDAVSSIWKGIFGAIFLDHSRSEHKRLVFFLQPSLLKKSKDVSRYIFGAFMQKLLTGCPGRMYEKLHHISGLRVQSHWKGTRLCKALSSFFHCCCCSWVENYLSSLHFTAPLSAHFNPFHIVHLKSWSPWMSLDYIII